VGPWGGVILSTWLGAFILTQLVEWPLYLRLMGKRRCGWLIAFGTSTISHPLIFVGLPLVWEGSWVGYVICAEGIAVLMESLWLHWFKIERPIFWALIANGCSLVVGLLSRWILDWP